MNLPELLSSLRALVLTVLSGVHDRRAEHDNRDRHAPHVTVTIVPKSGHRRRSRRRCCQGRRPRHYPEESPRQGSLPLEPPAR